MLTSAGSHRRRRLLSLDWWTSVAGVVTAISALIAVAGLVVALVAWLRPQSPPQIDANGCMRSAPADRTVLARTAWMGLEFYCGGQRLPILQGPPYGGGKRDVAEVRVGNAPFEIHGPIGPTGMMICAWTDETVFGEIQEGTEPYEDINSPFALVKGMADTAAGSGTIFIENEAMNVLAEGRISSLEGNRYAAYISSFEFTRDAAGRELGRHDSIYIVVFADVDKDGVVDDSDYELVILRR